jgi:hypothetical protein
MGDVRARRRQTLVAFSATMRRERLGLVPNRADCLSEPHTQFVGPIVASLGFCRLAESFLHVEHHLALWQSNHRAAD